MLAGLRRSLNLPADLDGGEVPRYVRILQGKDEPSVLSPEDSPLLPSCLRLSSYMTSVEMAFLPQCRSWRLIYRLLYVFLVPILVYASINVWGSRFLS